MLISYSSSLYRALETIAGASFLLRVVVLAKDTARDGLRTFNKIVPHRKALAFI